MGSEGRQEGVRRGAGGGQEGVRRGSGGGQEGFCAVTSLSKREITWLLYCSMSHTFQTTQGVRDLLLHLLHLVALAVILFNAANIPDHTRGNTRTAVIRSPTIISNLEIYAQKSWSTQLRMRSRYVIWQACNFHTTQGVCLFVIHTFSSTEC
jgi:hypothetical protein